MKENNQSGLINIIKNNKKKFCIFFVIIAFILSYTYYYFFVEMVYVGDEFPVYPKNNYCYYLDISIPANCGNCSCNDVIIEFLDECGEKCRDIDYRVDRDFYTLIYYFLQI
jgi:hypothetical protein